MGDRMERQLASMFAETEHWWAQRAAASGAATDADLPDVTFAHDGVGFAAEEKTTSDGHIYVREDELEALRAYADAYGMRPVIIGRFKRSSPAIKGSSRSPRAFYLWNPTEMEVTSSGHLTGWPGDKNWSARIAEPTSPADAIHPKDLSGFHLEHALRGELGEPVTEPPENQGLVGGGA